MKANIDTKPKQRKPYLRKPKGRAMTKPPVHPHSIDIGPIVRPVSAGMEFVRRRLLILSALAIMVISTNHYDTQDIRAFQAQAPIVQAKCERDMHMAGYLRRWGTVDTQAHGPRAVAQTVEWASLAEGFHADCQNAINDIPLPQRKTVQLWRDWQSEKRLPEAEQPRRYEGQSINVAFTEGTAP